MSQANKPRFLVSPGVPLSIEKIVRGLDGVSINLIQQALETKLLEHYQLFGHQPYSIVYDRRERGYAIQAGPIIGLIDFGFFEIVAQPKFTGLDIGKCLHLAHHCQLNSLVKHSNSLVEDELSNINQLTSIDYFAITFLSAVTDVVNNGLLRRLSSIEGLDPNFRGTLLADRHIATGSNPLEPYTRRSISIHDVPVNRTLKAALQLCKLHCISPQVQSLSAAALNNFEDVSENIPGEGLIYQFESTLPRDEYKRALTFARIILEGFDPLLGETSSFLPSFTLNLDQLFEKFVAFELRQKLRTEIYDVLYQQSYSHPSIPVLTDKIIQPDIVVQSRSKNSKIILDTKNKYSLLTDRQILSISNSDLYQITYYCLSLETNVAILVYPGNTNTMTQYPFRGSEGEAKYERKRQKALERIQLDSSSHVSLNFSDKMIEIYFWRINLEGKMHDTMESIAQLALFVADLIKGKI